MINIILVKLPSKFLIYKITTSFDKNFDPLSMKSGIEVVKLEPGPTFETTIIDIKDNHLKINSSSTKNIPDITLFDKDFGHLIMNNRTVSAKFVPEPTFENTINDIKDNYMKSISSVEINVSDTTLNKPY